MKLLTFIGCLTVVLSLLVACAAQRPVLYPNAHYKETGEALSQGEIDACLQLAEASGAKEKKGKEVAKQTAGAAAIGGASSAAWGAVYGDAAKRGKAGAAAGAAGALVHGAMKSNEPGGVYRGFVERCLQEKGFDVIGWR